MTMMPPGAKTFTSREFNQRAGEAKKAASNGPVFITDRGQPAHVLMTIAEYERLSRKFVSLAEALEQKGVPDFDFEIPPRSKVSSLRDPEF